MSRDTKVFSFRAKASDLVLAMRLLEHIKQDMPESRRTEGRWTKTIGTLIRSSMDLVGQVAINHGISAPRDEQEAWEILSAVYNVGPQSPHAQGQRKPMLSEELLQKTKMLTGMKRGMDDEEYEQMFGKPVFTNHAEQIEFYEHYEQLGQVVDATHENVEAWRQQKIQHLKQTTERAIEGARRAGTLAEQRELEVDPAVLGAIPANLEIVED